ncbi:holin-associated N-acetylmuramidase [Cognatishimia sp. SS12]|uniref:holin-associated N-acetylmuramidase n=1 Tax=Cognatishimia sp. SS12 TaxID=2979465 RepID=UPI00232C4374|nr:holin-associated N-acetylmuramidase [Cognatishimia sp. SS12]MDC0737454.1 holin-associated N-acetylmuramidase [Cognatishimia sp. SS12]
MDRIQAIATEILAREGGYVNDPDDPGGPTKYGVTLATLRAVRGDDSLGVAALRRLSKAQAIEIFIQHYYTAPGIAILPEPLQPSVFDMYVNAGRNAVKILQRLLGQMGQSVAVDGVIGPQTARAAAEAAALAPHHLVDAYAIARRNYYLRLADQRAPLRKFARTRAGGKGGWIKRAESFMSQRYHLSEAEFKTRVAAWG